MPPDFEWITELIQCNVQPDTWDNVGGPRSIAHHMVGHSKVLVVSQTQDAQEEVVAFLRELRAAIQSAAGTRKTTIRCTCPGAARPSRRSRPS